MKVTILYGSQTGQAEAISTEIADRLSAADVEYEYFCMDEVAKQDITEFFAPRRVLVVVISSTGDGDPPDNAAKFVRKLNNQELPLDSLAHVRYALLGLGDSNYSTFHGCPKKVEKRLQALSASPFYATGLADDAVGLEAVAEPWMEELLPALLRDASKTESNGEIVKLTLSVADTCIRDDSSLPFDFAFPSEGPCLIRGKEPLATDTALRVPIVSKDFLSLTFTGNKLTSQEEAEIPWQGGSEFPGSAGGLRTAQLLEMKRITKEGATKTKFQMTLELGAKQSDEAMSVDNYEPGDAFYFLFPNPFPEVNYILHRLGLEGDEEVNVSLIPDASKPYPAHIPHRATPRNLLTHSLDIRRNLGRPFLRMLAEATSDASEKRRLLELCSSQGSTEMVEFVKKPGLSPIDILHAFPSANPSLQRLIEHLPRLQPRPYSVASARAVDGTRVRFAFSEVPIPSGEGRAFPRHGLSTAYLLSLTPPTPVRVIFQEPKYFRLPAEPETKDLLLIGPGTGVTPFLSFLRHLRHVDGESGAKRSSQRWLFFGSRQLDLDGIYLFLTPPSSPTSPKWT